MRARRPGLDAAVAAADADLPVHAGDLVLDDVDGAAATGVSANLRRFTGVGLGVAFWPAAALAVGTRGSTAASPSCARPWLVASPAAASTRVRPPAMHRTLRPEDPRPHPLQKEIVATLCRCKKIMLKGTAPIALCLIPCGRGFRLAADRCQVFLLRAAGRCSRSPRRGPDRSS
jgi:hypothetical protein